MPTYALTPLPPPVEVAISVLGGNPARVGILAFLRTHPGARVSDIAEASELSVNTVKNHVSALAEMGVLAVDPPLTTPYSERRGQHSRYTVNDAVLAEHYRELGAILGLGG